jgi:hypothetical protein
MGLSLLKTAVCLWLHFAPSQKRLEISFRNQGPASGLDARQLALREPRCHRPWRNPQQFRRFFCCHQSAYHHSLSAFLRTCEPHPPIRPDQFSVFEIRDALFSIRKTEEALAFFQAYGPWQLKQLLGTETEIIRLSSLLNQRDFYRDALLTGRNMSGQTAHGDEAMRKLFEGIYLWQPLPMEMVFKQPPAVVVRCKDIQDGLRASVFLDKVEGFSWRRCARKDCGKVYRLETKHAKLYCTPECAHLQASRDYNNRKRKTALKVRAKSQAKTGGED